MPMKPVTVTARLRGVRNAPLVGATIHCEIDKFDFVLGGAIALPGVVTAQTDFAGEASFELWTTTEGAFSPTYAITISHYSLSRTTKWTGVGVPALDTISLTRLLGGLDVDIPLGAVQIGGGYFVLSTGTPVFV